MIREMQRIRRRPNQEAFSAPNVPNTLRMTQASWERIRSELLRPCGREHHLFGVLGRGRDTLTLQRLLVPQDDDYEIRSSGYVRLSQEFVLRVLRTFQGLEGAGLLDLHSHPFQGRASFSSTDLSFYGRMLAHVLDRVPEGVCVVGVLGSEESGFSLRAYDGFRGDSDVHGLRAGTGREIQEIEVVGRSGLRTIRSWNSPPHPATTNAKTDLEAEAWGEAYERNAEIRTNEESRRVAKSRVTVVGAGGIGSEMARQVALLGVRDITIVDGDRIERRNANRLLWASADDVGRYKVDRLAEELRRHDPAREVRAIRTPFPSSEAVRAVERADMVLVGVDSDRTRFDVLRLCVRHLRPAVDAGTAVYLDDARERDHLRAGHVWLYLPGSQRCWLDMGLDGPGLWDPGLVKARRNAGYVVGEENGASPGSIQTLNALVTALAVQAAEQVLMGRDPGAEMTQVAVDTSGALQCSLRSMRVAQEHECPLCGDEGFEGVGGHPFQLPAKEGVEDPQMSLLPLPAPAESQEYRPREEEGDDIEPRTEGPEEPNHSTSP